ncbi:hypothetical protein [Streptomyces sp. NPDC018947]|uniref:hypothetical protein n=1 Tax=Streptomyces sp. NPDC018947 TaxID=3365054 RepID=UPI0037AF5592
MGWTFKLHGGVTAGLGATLLALATLTWLPGSLPLTGARRLAAAIFALLFLTSVSALVRLILTGADKRTIWLAFRCLPGKVQLSLGALALWGVVLVIFSTATEGNLQSAEVRDGRYVALDTAPYARGTVMISQSRYQDVLENDLRTMLAIPAVLSLGAAYAVLAAGELRRADGAVVPCDVR